MTIRTTDISKRPHNTPEEATYAAFCEAVKEHSGIGTQDAMRKNLFLDLHRMGLIDRYNARGKKIMPYERAQIKYVGISTTGLKLIQTKNLLNKYFLYSKAINVLLGGLVETLINMVLELGNLTVYEYIFFASAINAHKDFSITQEEAVSYVRKYRSLSRQQRIGVVDTIKAEANPNNFQGDKTHKRDFHNWKNMGDQLFWLISQTVYFENMDGMLKFRLGKDSAYQDQRRLSRSINEKHAYFESHVVKRTPGFELHHIVPLAWSESLEHFKILDSWKNMIYLDAYKHALITQNNNRNTKLGFANNDVILSDISKHDVRLKFNLNVKYRPTLKDQMLAYNHQLNGAVAAVG